MVSADLLMVRERCVVCNDPRWELLVRTTTGTHCIGCYLEARPQPELPPPTAEDLRADEQRWAGVRAARNAS